MSGAGGYGGVALMPTRKIADLPKRDVCRDPEHAPSRFACFEPGVYIHTCPTCGHDLEFVVPEGPTLRGALPSVRLASLPSSPVGGTTHE